MNDEADDNCLDCDGTGDCDCDFDPDCKKCGGTGVCATCNGTGQAPEDEDEGGPT